MIRLLLTIFLTTALALAGCREEGKANLTTKESVESFLQQQVKVGATRDSVIAALDAKGIEHSGDKDSSTIYAMIRVPDEKAVVKRGFQLKFDFAGGRLSGYTVSEKFTGP